MGGRLSTNGESENRYASVKTPANYPPQSQWGRFYGFPQPVPQPPPPPPSLAARTWPAWCCCGMLDFFRILGALAGTALLAALVFSIPSQHAGPDVGEGADDIPEGYCSAADIRLPELVDFTAAGLAGWAGLLVSSMTVEEKMRLVKGVGWSPNMKPIEEWYVGNILGIPRLGVPSMQMQDASQGFRTSAKAIVGQVTAWPCALAITASWDVDATRQWAKAVGEEFKTKGANVILGPGVNVHRVAFNGRNAEYLSGEDPALGAQLVTAWVKGMQDDAGVAAVVKHFPMNEQETNRQSVNVVVDEKTQWEQYYPPFEAAVQAGVAAVMCSYSFVNGEQACSSSQALSQDLKGTMGFNGWVMTDWWALQNGRGPIAGVDQEQPGVNGYFTQEALVDRLDDMAGNVLKGMARGSSTWRMESPLCRLGCSCRSLLMDTVATNPANVALAYKLAANGAVLLQNEERSLTGGPTLPLGGGETVAVLGTACARRQNPDLMVGSWTAGDYYVVGGSGRVLSLNTVSVLQGLQSRGVVVQESPNEDLTQAQVALQGAHVALVCAGATTGESTDRATLHLDQEDFINQVVQMAAAPRIPVVVLMLIPGAVVAPWRHSVSAILAFFLSGQETGNAAADILLGKVTPSGKLPVTFPEVESDAIKPCPSVTCDYAEHLYSGWHVYDGKPVAFPFGHGLSYTSFDIFLVKDWSIPFHLSGVRNLTVGIQNMGRVAGAEVVQLYVGFPEIEGNRPKLALRGFKKTPVLAPGAQHQVHFSLGSRDLSVWDSGQHGWRLLQGQFVTKLGFSSRDLRLCGGFEDLVPEPMGPC